ncbi:hypothetical protein [Bulleidia sp. zg-1006]|uniref:hypothetical protein n=1 Tax=Bulleidia sp. zg-1006 TaxID=2806552 RepID=UPI0019397746|nr:hypothetical protein [Bulleidia sp. zg-1006]QRG86076.1 hypothetical protein JOS54_04165 [Bulleidia sp. zg-1006]
MNNTVLDVVKGVFTFILPMVVAYGLGYFQCYKNDRKKYFLKPKQENKSENKIKNFI